MRNGGKITRKILTSIIIIVIIITGLFSGCYTTTYDLNNYKVRLLSVKLFNGSNLNICFCLNITNYQGEQYRLGGLKYTIDGNSYCLCGGEICSFTCGNTTLCCACGHFEDTISLDEVTINPELNNALINKQPIIWLASGELTLYDEYTLTGITSVIKVPFDGLIYYMTEHS